MHTIKKQKRITQSQLWRTEIWFASVEIESHWKAWILNYLEFNTGWCMSRVEQTTYEPVLWCRAVPKTGGVLCILAQLCLSFIRSPAHHAQPFQKMQNLLYLCNCLITAVFKIYLNTLMFDVLNSVRKTTVPSAFSYLKLIIGIDSALIYIVSLLLFFNLLFFFFLNNQALIQDIWLIKLRPSAAVLSPADLHCLKSVTCFRAAVSHCLFLCQLFYCKSAPFTQHTATGLCLLWWPFTIAVALDNLYQNTGHVQKPVIQQTVVSAWKYYEPRKSWQPKETFTKKNPSQFK